MQGSLGNATNSVVKRSESVSKIQLLVQAISAASSSLNLAKQLIQEIERQGGGLFAGTADVPGLVGKYDGMFMITEAGKKYPVPDNYSAKTKLVYGDKLKMIEGPEGRRFKLLTEAPRVEAEAQLAQKDGRFEALGKEGSYKLLQGAVRWWSGAEGDKVKILLPTDEKHPPFAALVEIIGKKPGEGEEGVVPALVKKLPVPAAVRTSRSAQEPSRASRDKNLSPSTQEPSPTSGVIKPAETPRPKTDQPEAQKKEPSSASAKGGEKLSAAKPTVAKSEGASAAKKVETPKEAPPAEKKAAKPIDEEEELR